MLLAGAALLVVLAIWVLAFVGVPFMVAVAAAWICLGIVLFTGLIGPVAALIVAALLLPAAIAVIPPLRRRLVGERMLRRFARVLPPMTGTEREALEAGDVWWEGELFRGRPDWKRLQQIRITELDERERDFLDNQVSRLCAMLDEDHIVREQRDLPPEVWAFLKQERFFSLIIPREHGGLGFSSLAQSAVVSKIASRSLCTAVTVMVPNSLGPGELLMQYGTTEQQHYWLPRLASGEEIPCFALTGPDVGSDAGSMPDYGIVCRGLHEGREVLGIRLSFNKRYITLAPVATVLGLAFRLHDPDRLLGDEEDCGITCALIPADHPGVEIGDRHFPMGLAFMNGPIRGSDVFIPMDWIIGGPAMAGKGWRMLVECLSVGRALSLPALAAAAGKVGYRMTGAYARIRRQFRLPIGHFEGVQEAMVRIGGFTYMLEASRVLTASAGDLGVKPSVVSAIAKYHMTEMMRAIVNDAMDVHGGRGIMLGPRNYLAYGYLSVPVGITVEGANILTRSLMIFGQGAMRCHPFVLREMEAVRRGDVVAFDRLLYAHVGHSVNRAVRAFTHGLTASRFAASPVSGADAAHFRNLERMSAALAFVADATMGALGGDLKRRESLSARLGDVLSYLYLGSAVLKYHHDGGGSADEQHYVDWCLGYCLNGIQVAFDSFFDNFPKPMMGRVLRFAVFPLGRAYKPPRDSLGRAVSLAMMEPGGARDRITAYAYWGRSPDDASGRMEHAFSTLVQCEPIYEVFLKAVAKGRAKGFTFEERLEACEKAGIVSAEDAALLREYEALRFEAISTDAFPAETLAPLTGLCGGASGAVDTAGKDGEDSDQARSRSA